MSRLPSKFVPRASWGARPPRRRVALPNPTTTTAHYEGVTLGDYPHASCAGKVRAIQNFHMDARGWVDGAYSCVICDHGYVFEMRGPGVRTGANGTNEGNRTGYAMCFLMGPGDTLTPEAKYAGAEAVEWLLPTGAVNGHRDWKPTACPGEAVYAAVRSGAFNDLPGPAPAPPTPTPTPADPDEEEIMGAKDEIIGTVWQSVRPPIRLAHVEGRPAGEVWATDGLTFRAEVGPKYRRFLEQHFAIGPVIEVPKADEDVIWNLPIREAERVRPDDG